MLSSCHSAYPAVLGSTHAAALGSPVSSNLLNLTSSLQPAAHLKGWQHHLRRKLISEHLFCTEGPSAQCHIASVTFGMEIRSQL